MAFDEVSDFLKTPPWLDQHPEIQRRGIHLVRTLRPGTVFATDQFKSPQTVVKIVDPSTEEANILDSLQRDIACPASHVVPCDVVRSDKLLAIMPCLASIQVLLINLKKLSNVLDVFDQLLEGVAYLHDRGIAHMDLCSHNVRAAFDREAAFDPRLKAYKLYIIDFDRSRKLDLKPGVQGAVALPETVCRHPNGITHLDPYSWDVYCAGILFLEFLERVRRNKPLPCIVDRFAQWVVGDERGCSDVCRCRPTARRARQVLTFVRWVINASERCNDIFSVVTAIRWR
ncbi:hypothetical protein BD311DRAFT_706701 [Dichomitus squalens]|uniref:Protein kinase domain-containing protein n=1 Tax=Dichomitus squalens TaxID=114155 RepID=A0A4Q9M7S6_9APHY|nr:hypothetical protein BD311DRAFT_706701 [Dichomitus squalens]